MMYFSARNLQKTYAKKIVFSLEAEKNSMTAIIGPSGSGKSTVLNLIAGLVQSEGDYSIILDGKDISRLPPGKRGIGMVFQSPALFSHMNIADNVSYGLRNRGFSKKDCYERASLWLEKTGLGGFEKRFPETLSGGEARRVSLIRTLIVEPRLVLLDEPFSNLDAPLRDTLIAHIAALKKETGFTGILVTHDRYEAEALDCGIAVMYSETIMN